ncbi:MAG: thioesterase-3 [Flavobacteriales bacterium]|jgi:thioesterase-3
MKNKLTDIIVRGYHLDGYAHVNNARYLEFLEEARWQYFDYIPAEWYKTSGLAFVIVNININYKFSATFGDVLSVETEVEKIGNTSMVFSQKVALKNSSKAVCDAKITFVILNTKTGKPVKIEGDLLKLLKGK